jgi:hypothetical protein
MFLRKCAGPMVLGLAALLLAGGAQAQLSITNYEFSSVAVDYPANPGGGVPNSLQGSLGQTMVTVDPPTNTGVNLAFLGFWETGVKFRYKGNIDLEDFGGSYPNVPINIRFWNTDEDNNDTVTVALDASGNYVADSWMNPSFVAALSAKSPNHLRHRVAPTIPGDPLLYPTTNFFLRAADANNDNSVDVLDLDQLIQAFDKCQGDVGFLPGADFNYDGCADVLDLDLLIRNFDQQGDE